MKSQELTIGKSSQSKTITIILMTSQSILWLAQRAKDSKTQQLMLEILKRAKDKPLLMASKRISNNQVNKRVTRKVRRGIIISGPMSKLKNSSCLRKVASGGLSKGSSVTQIYGQHNM